MHISRWTAFYFPNVSSRSADLGKYKDLKSKLKLRKRDSVVDESKVFKNCHGVPLASYNVVSPHLYGNGKRG